MRRRTFSENTIAANEIAIIRKNKPVRVPIVSGSPTEGGFAGYLMFGTITSVTNAPSASHADNARALNAPTRPYANANTNENSPPKAAPYVTTAHQFGFGRFAFGGVDLFFEGNRLIDLRLSHQSGEAEREQSRGNACKHAAYQQFTNHVRLR
jgi:hypothetical protein